MIRLITYTILAILLTIASVSAQENTFESKIKNLSTQLDKVIKTEKNLLKNEIKAIEKKYNNDEISFDEANKLKADVTKLHATNISSKTLEIENKINDLVQGKVDVSVNKNANNKGEKPFKGSIDWKTAEKKYNNKRTESYLVLAFGLNNLMLNGNLSSIQDSEFEFGKSHFFEFGLNFKSRLLKNASLLYANYGLAFRYNNLRPKDNKYFVTNNNETLLQNYNLDLKSSRFKNVQLVLPLMFELDFSKPRVKNDKKVYHRNRSFRIGFGGFGGVNLKTKQILRYELNGKKVRDKEKGDFNVNNFVYGLQGLIGYRDTSFYVKYDMQDLFTNSYKGQKNISFGVRVDL